MNELVRWRWFLVAVATALTWRLDGETGLVWTVLSVLLCGTLLEAFVLDRFHLAGGGDRHPALLTDQPPTGKLRVSVAARVYPLVVAVIVAMVWGMALEATEWIRLSLAFSLLAVASPTSFRYARLLAWPEAAVVVGRLWRSRVSPERLARLAACRTVVMPKFGWLTTGRCELDAVEAVGNEVGCDEVLRMAAALCQNEHDPRAVAVRHGLRQRKLGLPRLQEVTRLPGPVYASSIAEVTWRLGSPPAIEALGVAVPEELREGMARHQTLGGTVWLLARGDELVGLVRLGDELRRDGNQLIGLLRAGGVRRVALITDDELGAVAVLRTAFDCDEVLTAADQVGLAATVDRWRADGPVAAVTRTFESPILAELADVRVALARQDEAAEDADLVCAAPDPTRLPAAWLSVGRLRDRDRRTTHTLWLGSAAVLVAALAGLALPTVVILDQVLILALLSAHLRRVRSTQVVAKAATA